MRQRLEVLALSLVMMLTKAQFAYADLVDIDPLPAEETGGSSGLFILVVAIAIAAAVAIISRFGKR